MSYGDGLASLLGIRYGRRKYRVFGETRSYVGSCAMFVFTFVLMIVALLFYQIPLSLQTVLFLAGISLVASIVEGLTPKGLDNLSVPFVTVLLYWFVFISGIIV